MRFVLSHISESRCGAPRVVRHHPGDRNKDVARMRHPQILRLPANHRPSGDCDSWECEEREKQPQILRLRLRMTTAFAVVSGPLDCARGYSRFRGCLWGSRHDSRSPTPASKKPACPPLRDPGLDRLPLPSTPIPRCHPEAWPKDLRLLLRRPCDPELAGNRQARSRTSYG